MKLYLFTYNALFQQDVALPRRDSKLIELLNLGHKIGIVANEPEVGEGAMYPTMCRQKYTEILRALGLPFKHCIVNPTSLHYNFKGALYAWVCMDVMHSDAPWNQPDLAYRALPSPVMPIEAMAWHNITPDHTVLVGEDEPEELAARNSMCTFEWCEDFFRHSVPVVTPTPETFRKAE